MKKEHIHSWGCLTKKEQLGIKAKRICSQGKIIKRQQKNNSSLEPLVFDGNPQADTARSRNP